MSTEGMKKAADVFAFMQTTRIELLDLWGETHDNRDILFAQMLEDGKEAMKKKFLKITVMEDKP